MPAEDVGPGRGERRRLPWLFLVLVVAAITSSSLSVISLYHVLALQAEVEGLRAEVVRKREEQSGTLEEPMNGAEKQTHQHEHEEIKDRIEVWTTLCTSNVLLKNCLVIDYLKGLHKWQLVIIWESFLKGCISESNWLLF